MRVRTDNVFGTVTDDPLTSGATTLNSAGLTNLDTVANPDEALITLDPNRVSGAPEIVVVTAHSASATSATITRGAFGTTARQHSADTEWVHGPIGGNSTTLVDDANDQGDYLPMGEWEDYTPSNSNVTVGDGTQVARFMRVGRTIHWTYQLEFGSTTAFTGTVRIGLPVDAATYGVTSHRLVFGACYLFESGVSNRQGVAVSDQVSSTFVIHDGGAIVNATSPFTWGTGDVLSIRGSYEAAT